MTFAIVPAGGFSTRMGRPKLSLPLGNSTVLGYVIAALRDGGVNVVLVVVGPHQPELVPLAESAGAKTLLLPAPTADMRETVQVGLRWLNEQYHPRDDACWLLAPGDCPAFSATTVRTLFDCAASDSTASIFIPTVNAKRGHPTLFSWRHAAGILQIPAGSGIDSYVRNQPNREVPVDDSGVLCDLDTPADYERFRNSQ